MKGLVENKRSLYVPQVTDKRRQRTRRSFFNPILLKIFESRLAETVPRPVSYCRHGKRDSPFLPLNFPTQSPEEYRITTSFILSCDRQFCKEYSNYIKLSGQCHM